MSEIWRDATVPYPTDLLGRYADGARSIDHQFVTVDRAVPAADRQSALVGLKSRSGAGAGTTWLSGAVPVFCAEGRVRVTRDVVRHVTRFVGPLYFCIACRA